MVLVGEHRGGENIPKGGAAGQNGPSGVGLSCNFPTKFTPPRRLLSIVLSFQSTKFNRSVVINSYDLISRRVFIISHLYGILIIVNDVHLKLVEQYII